ncbi:unnamed protein product [Staurois parvus]|uniref:Gap junction protein n=1 Tax=Staurois parvus TaxID=386267 RepID=A0ABN9B919_9NEOB|nr:unnamed protein product [Staurois parvus]
MGHAMHTIRMEEKKKFREEEMKSKQDMNRDSNYHQQVDEISGKIRLQGSLLNTYVCSILIRTVMEVAFIVGQYMLYGIFLETLYICKRKPCPHPVNCYVSRPTEKNVFIVFMLAVAILSLLLSLVELYYLSWKALKQKITRPPPSGQNALRVATIEPEHRSQSCTPPPDFNQCLSTGKGKFGTPFNNTLASQQNTVNFATERVQTEDDIGQGQFIHINYSQNAPVTNHSAPHHLPNGYCQSGRRLSKTSRTSSKARSDDLAV